MKFPFVACPWSLWLQKYNWYNRWKTLVCSFSKVRKKKNGQHSIPFKTRRRMGVEGVEMWSQFLFYIYVCILFWIFFYDFLFVSYPGVMGLLMWVCLNKCGECSQLVCGWEWSRRKRNSLWEWFIFFFWEINCGAFWHSSTGNTQQCCAVNTMPKVGMLLLILINLKKSVSRELKLMLLCSNSMSPTVFSEHLPIL